METHYLYKITDTLNNKVYIGQTADNKKRWSQHKAYAKHPEKTGQYIHRAIAKYGVENFIFEIIAACKTQEDTDETESVLIEQYDSRNKEHGYNLMIGGSHGGHSEETKKKQSDATFKQIAEKGHPAQGTKRTPEQIQHLVQARQENPVEYTPEIRQRMSEAHIGHTESEETKQKKSEAATSDWEKRNAIREATGELKCNAPGCNISGSKQAYKMINGISYCNKHGLRLWRYGRLDRINP
jgi:group I intron endonuclease